MTKVSMRTEKKQHNNAGGPPVKAIVISICGRNRNAPPRAYPERQCRKNDSVR
jgi:hypothetical protein